MTGAQLKMIIERSGYTKKRLAEMLGMNDQRWTEIFGSPNVKSGHIEKVAEALGKSIAELYGEGDTITASDHSTAFKGYMSCDSRLLDIIQEKDRVIEKLVAIIERNGYEIPSDDGDEQKQSS